MSQKQLIYEKYIVIRGSGGRHSLTCRDGLLDGHLLGREDGLPHGWRDGRIVGRELGCDDGR